MIKRFIITIVGLYVNVLERPSAVQRPWAGAEFDPHNYTHAHTHTHSTPRSPLSSVLFPCHPKPEELQGSGANREMSLPLLLLPLRIADTDQHTEPLLTERREKRGSVPAPQKNMVALGCGLRDLLQS